MALSTKFFYELAENKARIQFYSDDVLINEWVATNGHETSQISVPTSPGNTIPRIEWINARLNVKKWIRGIDNCGLSFCDHRPQSNFCFEMKQKDNNKLELKLEVQDTLDTCRTLREIEYNKTTDMITLEPRAEAFAIFWIDYLNLLLAQDQFEILVNKLHTL